MSGIAIQRVSPLTAVGILATRHMHAHLRRPGRSKTSLAGSHREPASEVVRKKAEWKLLEDNSKAGAATGAANLAVLRRLRGADLAPKREGRSPRKSPPPGRK